MMHAYNIYGGLGVQGVCPLLESDLFESDVYIIWTFAQGGSEPNRSG